MGKKTQSVVILWKHTDADVYPKRQEMSQIADYQYEPYISTKKNTNPP